MADKLTRERANQIINEIRVKYGGVRAEYRKYIEAHMPEILDSISSLQVLNSGSITALVQNLYSRKTRFLYEIIQNAEDNAYTLATARGQDPSLTFSLLSDRVIIDSNEDGFSESNVRAICATDASTKREADGYIGEKGIGFKSVFKVAKKVFIHSDPFHFSFEYTREGSSGGMGMVTPIQEDAISLPSGVRTRMVLMLADSVGYEQMEDDFRNVPDTFLLFLQKLKTLTFNFQPRTSKDIVESVVYSKHETSSAGVHATYLRKSTSQSQSTKEAEQKYYVVKSRLENLPYHESRIVKKTGASIDHAEVVLAFPVHEDDTPIVKPQHTFAFLPLRRVGFPFLVQSDFVTLANREDVEHSERNKTILVGVAKLYRTAMLYFCKHPRLQWTWMRYLPDESISNDFWNDLGPLIRGRLKDAPLLKAMDGNGLYSPLSLYILSYSMLDQNGSPLLADLTPPIYLSTKYAEDDRLLLKRLGTTHLSTEKFYRLLCADVLQSSSAASRWKDLKYDAKWRAQLCDHISNYCVRNTQHLADVRKLPLIPVSNGRWRSILGPTAVHFPRTNGVSIPSDLGLDLVHDDAANSRPWKNLLSELGVTQCPHDKITNLILDKHNQPDNIKFPSAIAHARWLFNFHTEKSKSSNLRVALTDPNHIPVRLEPNVVVYFPETSHPFSPAALFKKQNSLPGYPAQYLHEDYLDAVASARIVNGRTWMQWLEQVVGIRRVPRISESLSDKLSPEVQYLIAHRKDHFPGTLRHFWDQIRSEMSPSIIEQLKLSKISCLNGAQYSLENTFLPLPKLKEIAMRNGVLETFPFLVMDHLLQDDERTQWVFLECFDIGVEDNLCFYLTNLEHRRKACPVSNSDSPSDRLLEIYSKIQSKSSDDLSKVREFFTRQKAVYARPSPIFKNCWVSPSECVWDGPNWLNSKRLIGVDVYKQLQPLFVEVLQIADASQADILMDLLRLRNQASGIDQMDVDKIYTWLSDHHSSSHRSDATNDLEVMRDTFEQSHLVFVSHLNMWYPPSQCVWAEPHVRIPWKASISGRYAQRKNFFTSKLRVHQPTKKMYIDSLSTEARKDCNTAELKQIMCLISSLGVVAEDVANLKNEKVLPIRLANGTRTFSSASKQGSTDFAIVDRNEHLNAFTGKIAMLDLNLEDIRDTRPFLVAMGLEDRFSSNIVKEITDVDGGMADAKLTESVRSKAKAIVRCAMQYAPVDQHTDANSLYQILSKTSVYTSNSIRKYLRLRQNGKDFEGAKTISNFHLKELEDSIDLFLPENKYQYIKCFERQLPLRFCDYLCVPQDKARSILSTIFRHEDHSLIDEFLEEEGIAKLDCELSEPDSQLDVSNLTALTSNLDLQHEPSEGKAIVVASSTALPPTLIPAPERPTSILAKEQSFSWNHSTSSLGRFDASLAADIELPYKQILQNIIEVARRRTASGFFGTGPFSFEQLQNDNVVPRTIIKQVFGSRVPDREFKLGAAGELYVFEYLKGLGLPNFGLDNWKSGIRNRVGEHPDYAGIKNHHDRSAIADIEYLDEQGLLTKFLIQKEFLDPTTWENQRPHYHIEVKSTNSENWQEPFFISKNQELHIRNHYFRESESSSNVYIICRLFNIGRGRFTGFNIYVNPELCRRKGSLEFTPYTWAVKPMSNSAYNFEQGTTELTNTRESDAPPSGGAFQASLFSSTINTGSGIFGTSKTPVTDGHSQNSTASTVFAPEKPSFETSTGLFDLSGASQSWSAKKARVSTNKLADTPTPSGSTGKTLFGSYSTSGSLFRFDSSSIEATTSSESRSSAKGGMFGKSGSTGETQLDNPNIRSSLGSASSKPPSSGLFGASSAPGTGLFGASSAPGSRLFGASSAPGSGLFGTSSVPGSGLFQTSSVPGSGLFQTSSASGSGLLQTSSASGSGLFQTSSAPGGGLFQKSNVPSSGLFQTSSAPGSGLFGVSSLPSSEIFNTPSTTSTGLFGASNVSSNISRVHPPKPFGVTAFSESVPIGGGLFGSRTPSSASKFENAAPKTFGGLFGAATPPTANPFGSPMSLQSPNSVGKSDTFPNAKPDPSPTTTIHSPEKELLEEREHGSSIKSRYQAITALAAYKEHSFEELRLQDYRVGLKSGGSEPILEPIPKATRRNIRVRLPGAP